MTYTANKRKKHKQMADSLKRTLLADRVYISLYRCYRSVSRRPLGWQINASFNAIENVDKLRLVWGILWNRKTNNDQTAAAIVECLRI